jgi:predicted aldo/keto reductase-like oxidoreductase
MLYRTFGKTGKKVSILGFGCMRLPILEGNPSKINEPLATEMLHYAIDHGVNYVDTAYPYHGLSFTEGGKSETFLGKALKNGYREQVLSSHEITQLEYPKKRRS